MKTVVFETLIRLSVSVKEAQCEQKSLYEYEPSANPAIDYKEFTYELIERLKGAIK